MFSACPPTSRPATRRRLPRHHRLEVLRRDDETTAVATVPQAKEDEESALEGLLTGFVEGGEGLVRRPVVRAEDLDPVLRRAEAKYVRLALRPQVGGLGSEQLHEAPLGPPGHGGAQPRRRRHEAADHLAE